MVEYVPCRTRGPSCGVGLRRLVRLSVRQPWTRRYGRVIRRDGRSMPRGQLALAPVDERRPPRLLSAQITMLARQHDLMDNRQLIL